MAVKIGRKQHVRIDSRAQKYKIMVSWRRACPSGETVKKVYNIISKRYGKSSVFFDIESDAGVNFPKKIRLAITHTTVVLIFVGSDWAGPDGSVTRILNKRDWVRQEVELAYRLYKSADKKGIAILPIHIDGATVPNDAELLKIEALWYLKYLDALPISSNSELTGIDKIITHLDNLLGRWSLIRKAMVGLVAVSLFSILTALFVSQLSIGTAEPIEIKPAPEPPKPRSEVQELLVPLKILQVGGGIKIELGDGNVLNGALGQETTLKDSVLVSTHPQSGFAIANATEESLANIVVKVKMADGEFETLPFKYGNGFAYVPGEASRDMPSEMRAFMRKR